MSKGIGGEKMGLLFDVIVDIILFYFWNDMKLKYYIVKLSELEWFWNLYEDLKYISLIWSNRKFKKFILFFINMEILIKFEKK